jgi:hypothetical protein
MSWGNSEFPGETSYDGYFTTPGVVYFSSAGDSSVVSWPCTSPNVVCAGGTSTARNFSTGNFLYEVTWDQGGGGLSAYEGRPSYQSTVANLGSTTFRGVPDVSFNSGYNTAFWVWDSEGFQINDETLAGWLLGWGTSFADVGWAGIVNVAGRFAPSSISELTTIYRNRFVSSDIRDITSGLCGPYDGYPAVNGWNFCTGVGSPVGYGGK